MKRVSKWSWLPVGLMMACGAQDVQEPLPGGPGDYEGISEAEGALTELVGQCTFNATGGVVTLDLNVDDVAMINKATDGRVMVNGFPCGAATSTNTKRIDITGDTGDEVVILDYLGGQFAMGTATSPGVVIDLVSGSADAVKIRGSKAADAYVFGTSGFAINADGNKDVTVANVDAFTVSLSDGNDTFSAAGNVATGAMPFGADVTVYGGDGNDTLRGGDGDDILNGGEGNDVFTTANADDGDDVYNGGNGSDTMDYSLRTVALTVDLDGMADDGEGAELDNVMGDVEVLKGGTAGDTLTGAAGSQTISGGAGDDIIDGGLGDDVLNGDAGNDVFNEGAVTNGADVFNGGAGTDKVNYGSRVATVTVTMDTTADDGLASEADKVMVDVENATTGSGVDTLTGSAVANVLDGGSGNDTISGGDGADTIIGGLGNDTLTGGNGDDTFDEGSATSGADTVGGGAGVDTVSYAARAVAVVVVMDGTASSGQAGETDTIGTDVENLIGGSAADTITGNAADNTLEGGSGTIIDTINGGAGEDVIDGGDGVDVIDCGAGDADILLDSTATPTNCEL